jgi:hypothetical protein
LRDGVVSCVVKGLSGIFLTEIDCWKVGLVVV